MKLSITNVRAAKDSEWDTLWRLCDDATYFHSREWAEIWKAYTEGRLRPDPRIVTFSDGREVLLPLSYRKSHRGLVKKYFSSPADTFGGWISKDPLTAAHGELLADYLTHRLGNIFWRLNPYDALASALKVKGLNADETQVLDLAQGFDAIHRRWTKGHKAAARRAEREGVRVQVAASEEDWKNYYKAYEETLARWGDRASMIYGWRLFEEMFRRHSPWIRLWLAFYEEKMIAGALCFYARRHAVYWHGAALKEFFHLGPVNFLMSKAIADACAENLAWFDFNPSGGHEGVTAFKKSFGSQRRPCPTVDRETRTARAVKRAITLLK